MVLARLGLVSFLFCCFLLCITEKKNVVSFEQAKQTQIFQKGNGPRDELGPP
jgi:hypothetical protein